MEVCAPPSLKLLNMFVRASFSQILDDYTQLILLRTHRLCTQTLWSVFAGGFYAGSSVVCAKTIIQDRY